MGANVCRDRFGASELLLLALIIAGLLGCSSIKASLSSSSEYQMSQPEKSTAPKAQTATTAAKTFSATVSANVSQNPVPEQPPVGVNAAPIFITFLNNNSCNSNNTKANWPEPPAPSAPPGAAAGAAQTAAMPRCVKLVIQQAIDVCVAKTYQQDLFDKYANYGIYFVLAATGLAGGIAALTHASSAQTTEITATTAGATALFSNLEKAVPPTAQASVTGMEGTGEAYLKVVSFPQYEDAVKEAAKYSALYDAVFSNCPSGVF